MNPEMKAEASRAGIARRMWHRVTTSKQLAGSARPADDGSV